MYWSLSPIPEEPNCNISSRSLISSVAVNSELYDSVKENSSFLYYT